MNKTEKYSRITITLPPDVAEWVKQKEHSLNSRDRRLRTSVSAIISDAVAEMKLREEQGAPPFQTLALNESGNVPAPPHLGGDVLKPHKQSAGGSETATTRYPNKRQQKSSR